MEAWMFYSQQSDRNLNIIHVTPELIKRSCIFPASHRESSNAELMRQINWRPLRNTRSIFSILGRDPFISERFLT